MIGLHVINSNWHVANQEYKIPLNLPMRSGSWQWFSMNVKFKMLSFQTGAIYLFYLLSLNFSGIFTVFDKKWREFYGKLNAHYLHSCNNSVGCLDWVLIKLGHSVFGFLIYWTFYLKSFYAVCYLLSLFQLFWFRDC